MEIKCPRELNQFLVNKPVFKNTFKEEDCEMRKAYGDCYHCFGSAIAKRDRLLKIECLKKLMEKVEDTKPTNRDFRHYVGEMREANKILDIIEDMIAEYERCE